MSAPTPKRFCASCGRSHWQQHGPCIACRSGEAPGGAPGPYCKACGGRHADRGAMGLSRPLEI